MSNIRSQEMPPQPSQGSLLSALPSSWRAALPAGLPPYALTLVQLGDDHQDGDWCEVAPELVASALSVESPVDYVQSGGLGSFHDFDDHFASIPDNRFRLFRDKDLVVEGPPLSLEQAEQPRGSVTFDGRPHYHCLLPSLNQIGFEVRMHEKQHARTVLAEAQLLRPYWLL